MTFLFNGGPGSGSVWLQMGAFGPKRVAIPSDARDDGAPPYPILDNPDSLLDATDLVFIDPPGTGFSHLIGKTDPKEFYGVTQDAKAVAEVIRRWLNDNGRWNSPKYLGGESYGTTRSAAVANQLMNVTFNDVGLNGIILVSTILDFAAGDATPGNELGYITNLPSMAAVALYHGKAQAPSVEQFTQEARQFALGPYASALLKGEKLPAEERAERPPRAGALHRPLARPISSRPTSASPRAASSRSCCATAASPSAASIRATPARIMTMPAKTSTTTPASSASTPATRRRSTSGSAARSASKPTANISRSRASAASGTTASTAGATPI